MSKKIGIISLLLCLILLLSLSVFAAESPKISKIEVQEYPGQLQVNIYSTGQVQYKVTEQVQPDNAIIVDVFPPVFLQSVKTTPVNIASIEQIRVGQFSVSDGSGDPDIVRVIIDLTSPTEFQAALSNNGQIVALAIDAPGVTGPSVFAQAQSRPRTVIEEPPAQLVSCDLKNADLADVLKLFSDQTGENIVLGPDVQAMTGITLRLESVPLEKALNLVLRVNDLDYRRIGNVIVIDSPAHLAQVFPAPQPPEQLPEEVTTQVINLEYADAQSVAASVNAAFPSAATADNRIQAVIVRGTPDEIREIRGLIANLDVPGPPPPPPPPAPPPPVTQVFKVKYAKASDVAGQLGGLVAAGSIIVDNRLNSLIVTGSDGTLTTVKDFLASVDVPQPQVSLELKFLEVSTNASRNLGVSWNAAVESSWTEIDRPGEALDGGSIGLQTFARSALELSSTINFLLSSGQAKLLANPKITTMDGLQANIHLGDRIPLVYYDPRAGLYQATYIDVGVVLTITPIVNGDGYITTQVNPEISSVTNFIQNFPQVTTRSTNTTVRVKDGETIIIGGLLSDNERISLQKIPILGDIPIIGALFRNKSTSIDSTEVVFMVTPRVLKY
jgi:type II secretory pathway component GspD/PulD (secretin)